MLFSELNDYKKNEAFSKSFRIALVFHASLHFLLESYTMYMHNPILCIYAYYVYMHSPGYCYMNVTPSYWTGNNGGPIGDAPSNSSEHHYGILIDLRESPN